MNEFNKSSDLAGAKLTDVSIQDNLEQINEFMSHFWNRELVRSALMVYREKLVKLKKKSFKIGDEYTAGICVERLRNIREILALIEEPPLFDDNDELPF